MRLNKRISSILMKKKLIHIISFYVFLFMFTDQGNAGADIKITFENGIFSVQNDLFERQFIYDTSSRLHNFYQTKWIDKDRKIDLINEDYKGWFELCVNDKLIKSEDGGWDYNGFVQRPLENGGIEITIQLVGQKEASPVHEKVQLHYQLQVFPKSTFIRERIEIFPAKDNVITLNKHNNNIKLIFPKYEFNCFNANLLQVEEIKLSEWEGEILQQIDWTIRPNDRLQLSGGKSGRNLAQNHMYHPRRLVATFSENNLKLEFKGPIAIVVDELNQTGLIFAYEHGSPDNDMSQNYLAIDLEAKKQFSLVVQVRALKGAYVNGEKVTSNNPYSTVWVDVGYFNGSTIDAGEHALWNFLYFNQSEHLAPRKPTIYYNTWGLQRDDQVEMKERPQHILTEKRVLEEIENAHQLGVDVFVIDDGWQTCFGEWQPVDDRLPNGFMQIREKLANFGMRMGLWMAAEGIAYNSKLYKEHPEWLVKNIDGTETIGRWDKPIGCFSSGYKDYFIELCKSWIDYGVTYFKWDGLDKHLCYSPQHNHGDDSIDPEERAYRSGYDFILQVTDVAKKITAYNPEVIIVYDVTEKMRNVGLAFLSEARFFWINNGATWYDDLSYYRTKSIRSVANNYNQFIPSVLQTSATYPHQSEMYGAQRYNVNTTLLGGSGFWGDLSEMTVEDRIQVGEVVRLYKKVSHSVASTRPKVTGLIGASPEIYEFINSQKSEGQIIAFSGSALKTSYKTQPLNIQNFFCVLRNAYNLRHDGTIDIPLLFTQPDATCEAFILSNSQFQAHIESSTSWLKCAEISGENTFVFCNGAPGKQHIFWHQKLGKPHVYTKNPEQIKYQISTIATNYMIIIEEMLPDIQVEISPEIE